MYRLARAGSLLLLVVIGGCARRPDVGPYNPRFEAELWSGFSSLPTDDSAAAARRHIRERSPHLIRVGLESCWACVDLDVGLPVETRLGCVIHHPYQLDTKVYNAVVLEALRAGRLEEFRVKAREMPREQVRALFADGGGIRLEAGSPPLLAPGGRFRVALEPWPSRYDAPRVWVVDLRSGQRREPIRFRPLPAVVTFDPEGLALVRREDFVFKSGDRVFISWDLATGLPFQGFHDDPNRR